MFSQQQQDQSATTVECGEHVVRLLSPHEQAVGRFSISLGLRLKGFLTVGRISAAAKLLRERHQYLKCRLSDDLQYLIQINDEVPIKFSHSEVDKDDFKDWTDRFSEIRIQKRNFCEAVFFVTAFTPSDFFESTTKVADVFFTLSHGCSDGPSAFTIGRDFANYLEIISNSQTIAIPRQRSAIDVWPLLPHEKSEKLGPYVFPPVEKVLKYITADGPPSSSECFSVGSRYYTFSEDQSSILLSMCKSKGCSIQAIVTTLQLLGVLGAQLKANNPSSVLPCDAVCVVAIQIRDLVTPRISEDDIIVGGSAMHYLQKISRGTLWELVSSVTSEIKSALSNGNALRFFSLFSSGPPQIPTHFSTNMGKYHIPSGKQVQVEDVIFGTAINKHTNPFPFICISLYTVNEKMKMTVSWTDPYYSSEVIDNQEKIFFKAIDCLASSESIDIVSFLENFVH